MVAHPRFAAHVGVATVEIALSTSSCPRPISSSGMPHCSRLHPMIVGDLKRPQSDELFSLDTLSQKLVPGHSFQLACWPTRLQPKHVRLSRSLSACISDADDADDGTGADSSDAFSLRPPVKHFINLSNGLEALDELVRLGVPPSEICFCRIQSSHCEAQDFMGLLSSLDTHLMMHLALGYDCRIYDFGSRGAIWPAAGTASEGATEIRQTLYVPRALWWGVEWQRYVLNAIWGLPVQRTPLLRGMNVKSRFDEQLRSIPKPLRKRLRYYRSFVTPGLQEVRLRGYFAAARTDGDKEAHAAMLRQFLSDSMRAAASASAHPDPEDIGMQAYIAEEWCSGGIGSGGSAVVRAEKERTEE
uniref:Uncharacterized protein n=1 Tax=Chrysotila carterae TaxID=13221 RepID=A0A7S4C1R5_CHRCT